MIRFAALCANPKTFATYAANASASDLTHAQALLTGHRPKRLAPMATLLQWAAEATNTPDFLLQACLQASTDRAETAALLLPAPTGEPPTLTEALQSLTDRASLTQLWARLPPEANTILNRLATGTFRTTLPQTPPLTNQPPKTIRAIMTLVQPSGPEITLALWHDTTLIPITRLPLTLPETPQIMAWVRAHTTDRFGPIRQVEPTQIFELEYASTTPNRRRKCGLDLHSPRILRWLPGATAQTLSDLVSPDPDA